MIVSSIVAVARNGVIGCDGQLPWRLSTDLRRFRALTMGKPMIMGRKQYESVGRPLDGRDNIVLTRNPSFTAPGIIVVHDIAAALSQAHDLAVARGVDEIMIIGGAEVFALAMPRTSRIYLTEVHADIAGDVVFHPPGPPAWREVEREHHSAGPKDDYDFSYVLLERET